MTKAKFKFVFPKKNEEYEAQCNPMHLEPCTALIMSEHKVDLCMVYLDDTLQFICTYEEGKGFQRYYKDNSQRTELYLVYGNEDLMELADSDDFEGDAKVADRETLHNIVATRNPTSTPRRKPTPTLEAWRMQCTSATTRMTTVS